VSHTTVLASNDLSDLLPPVSIVHFLIYFTITLLIVHLAFFCCVQANRKVSHILEVWKAGLGVISLHVFQNVIACEAYTREACMIEAMGMCNVDTLRVIFKTFNINICM